MPPPCKTPMCLQNVYSPSPQGNPHLNLFECPPPKIIQKIYSPSFFSPALTLLKLAPGAAPSPPSSFLSHLNRLSTSSRSLVVTVPSSQNSKSSSLPPVSPDSAAGCSRPRFTPSPRSRSRSSIVHPPGRSEDPKMPRWSLMTCRLRHPGQVTRTEPRW